MITKYRSKKYRYREMVFDSKHEFDVWFDLRNNPAVANVERQVPFQILPAQYIDKKCVEKSVKYIADFVVTMQDGTTRVVDAKGMRTRDYILKRKMMLYFNKIRIEEV